MTNVIKYIEEMLKYPDYYSRQQREMSAFFVHFSIFDKIQSVPGVSIQNTCDYELQMGETAYSMKLIFVNADYNVMRNLCRSAEFSFPWEENLTLYVPLSLCSLLEDFIKIERLEYFVDYKTEAPGIIANNEMIRIVRFNINDHLKIDHYTKLFQKILRSRPVKYYPKRLYCVVAFPWLQPAILKNFDIEFENDNPIYAVIPVILKCTNNLFNNIFDLAALRMSFCNCRNLQPTEIIQSEIDRAIVRTLKDRKYFKKSNGFDLNYYMFDKNVSKSERNAGLIPYLVYTFQHFLGSSITTQNKIRYNTIKLTENRDPINMLKMKSNFQFKIDGQNFDGMNFKLFNDLAGCGNVDEIVLDTNYRLDDNMEFEPLNILAKDISLFMFGKNTHRFIEEFILCIQKFRFDNRLKLILEINCELSSYLIFDNLNIHILNFHDITITTAMLNDMHNCTNIGPKISFHKCKFENKWENWILLNNLKELVIAEIQEDDNTWESLFDFAEHMLSSTRKNEFEFKWNIYIISDHPVRIWGLKYVFDEHKTKLMLKNAKNNEILDLFHLKSKTTPDDKSVYDFYQ